MRFKELASREVKKHVGAIHIKGKLSLLQRKVANVLLLNAYDDLPIKDKHRIRIKDLAEIDCQRGSFLRYRIQARLGLLSLSGPDQEGFLGAGQLYRIQWRWHVLTVSVDWDKLDREESSAFLQSPINDDNTGRAFCKVDVYGTLLLFNYI